MCAVCKFIATAKKAFTNGKILKKTVNDKNIAIGIECAQTESTTIYHLIFSNQLLLQGFDQPSILKCGPNLRLKTLNILQFLSFSNVGQ